VEILLFWKRYIICENVLKFLEFWFPIYNCDFNSYHKRNHNKVIFTIQPSIGIIGLVIFGLNSQKLNRSTLQNYYDNLLLDFKKESNV